MQTKVAKRINCCLPCLQLWFCGVNDELHLKSQFKIIKNRLPGYSTLVVPQCFRQCIAGEGIQRNCTLGDKFLQFGMVLGMGIRFSKTTAYKLG